MDRSTLLGLSDLVSFLVSGTKSTGSTVSVAKLRVCDFNTDYLIGVGPTAGALIAWGFYKIIKVLEYEMANPGRSFFVSWVAAQILIILQVKNLLAKKRLRRKPLMSLLTLRQGKRLCKRRCTHRRGRWEPDPMRRAGMNRNERHREC